MTALNPNNDTQSLRVDMEGKLLVSGAGGGGTGGPSNLSVGPGSDTAFSIANDNGTGVTIPVAGTGGKAGVMSATMADKLSHALTDTTALNLGANDAGKVTVNLTYPTSATVLSGLDLPAATGSVAGVLSAADKTKIDNLGTTYLGISAKAASASAADKLSTARNINGVAFDGSADITVADTTKLPLAGGTLTGNLGVGAASPSWGAGWKAVDVSPYGALAVSSGGTVNMLANLYSDGTGGYQAKTTNRALMYQQDVGTGNHVWYSAASTTAGSTATLPVTMMLNASGNLLVGTSTGRYSTTGRGVLEVNGSASAIVALKINDGSGGYVYHNGTDLLFSNQLNGGVTIQTSAVDVSKWDASGNFGVGITGNPVGSNRVLEVGNNARTTTMVRVQCKNAGQVWTEHLAAGAATLFTGLNNTGATVFGVPTGQAGIATDNVDIVFAPKTTYGGKFAATGDFQVSTTGTVPSLTTTGEMVFNRVDDTHIKLSMRGSDGVTRSITLTLA